MVVQRVILHLDMDAFFAAVEQRERPELRGRPVLIGHRGPRGVVATCSYEARPSGVRSAMPSVTAARLCPDAVWVMSRFELYRSVSEQIFRIVRDAVPVVEQVSVDEASGDLTGAVADLAEGAALARRIKDALRASESLTVIAGVSYCRFLAKVASDLEKPDGLVVIGPADVQRRLWPLPVRVVPGIGPRTAARLQTLGVQTVAQLAAFPERQLRGVFGAGFAAYLHERAHGADDTPIEPGGGSASRSARSARTDIGTVAHSLPALLAGEAWP